MEISWVGTSFRPSTPPSSSSWVAASARTASGSSLPKAARPSSTPWCTSCASCSSSCSSWNRRGLEWPKSNHSDPSPALLSSLAVSAPRLPQSKKRGRWPRSWGRRSLRAVPWVCFLPRSLPRRYPAPAGPSWPPIIWSSPHVSPPSQFSTPTPGYALGSRRYTL